MEVNFEINIDKIQYNMFNRREWQYMVVENGSVKDNYKYVGVILTSDG